MITLNDVVVAVIVVVIVCVLTALIITKTKYTKKRYKYGAIIIPVSDDVERVDLAVKSAFFEESFDNTPYGREIIIVDFGCSPPLWEHYQKLAKMYPSVHAINSYELCAYVKVKYIQNYIQNK